MTLATHRGRVRAPSLALAPSLPARACPRSTSGPSSPPSATAAGARAGAAIPASAEAPAPSSEPIVRLAPRADLRLGEGAHAVGASLGVTGLHFVPDFLSSAEETSLARAVYHHEARFVTCRGGRRVQNHGGSPSSALVTEPLPPFAAALRDALVDAGVYAPSQAPNHVLVNEYLRPAGIAPHSDGDVYLDKVAIVTLEGAALMDFWPDDARRRSRRARSDPTASAPPERMRTDPPRLDRSAPRTTHFPRRRCG